VPDDSELAALSRAVGDAMKAAGLHLVTVESCTGGYVAKLLTDIPGSSGWYDGGWVTYSNAAKLRDVGVRAETLQAHGAVSEAVVREMAEGALARSGADRAIAISGVAGPDGGTARNPVGSVWFARARREAGAAPRDARVRVDARHAQLPGDRDAVRRAAAALALEWLAAE
jgi:nicotinamide-nucleotide amidase